MSSNCDSYIARIINDLEEGNQPTAIFFAYEDCGATNGSVWPPSAVDVSYGEKVSVSSSGQMCEGLSKNVATCKIPMIRSMIVPDGVTVEFWAKGSNDPSYTSRVAEFGYIKFDNTSSEFEFGGSIIKSFSQTPSAQSDFPVIWKSELTPDGLCSTPQAGEIGFTDGKMNVSSLSCGSPAFFAPLGIRTNYATSGGNYSSCGDDIEANQSIPETTYCSAQGNDAMSLGYVNANPSSTRCEITFPISFGYDIDEKIAPTGCDCIMNESESSGGCHCLDCNGIKSEGTIEYVRISTATAWTTQQIKLCTGEEVLSVEGIPIQRYGEGTAACDTLMAEVCSNTALMSDPDIALACTCISEQKQLNSYFSGLDLPVNCFTSVCSTDNPGVYRTSDQVDGCSAKLCQQIISVKGNYIMESGFSDLVCNGVQYNVSDTLSKSVSELEVNKDIPNNVSDIGVSGITLSTGFYVSLGLLGLCLILVIVWVLRSKRASDVIKKIQNKQKASAIVNQLNLKK